MNKCLPLFLIAFILIQCGSTHSLNKASVELKGSDLHPVGRYLFSNDKQLELIGTAVHFGFRFTGNSCTIFTSLPNNGNGYLQYELDGVYQKRVHLH